MPLDTTQACQDEFYDHEVKRRSLPSRSTKPVFEPGEIAYTGGGLKHAFYSYLRVSLYRRLPTRVMLTL
jgi:hypothetical protein